MRPPLYSSPVLLLLAPALAGVVGSPPRGATEVSVLACAGDGCTDRVFWTNNEATLRDVPVVMVDTILAERIAELTQGDAAVRAWNEALERARLAILDRKWSGATAALEEAERLMPQARPDNQGLFSFAFLHGAIEAGRDDDDRGLAAAAAVAWNRSVVLPAGLDAYAERYYAALTEALTRPPGVLVLDEAPADPNYELDGVRIGAAPIRVDLLPGTHYLRAADDDERMQWNKAVKILSGRATRTRARFAHGDDAAWVADALAAAVDERRMDEELGDILSEWADRHQLRRVRILRLDLRDGSEGARFSDYDVQAVWYEPRVRSFSAP